MTTKKKSLYCPLNVLQCCYIAAMENFFSSIVPLCLTCISRLYLFLTNISPRSVFLWESGSRYHLPRIIICADGNKLLYAVSSVLSLIAQKLHVSH